MTKLSVLEPWILVASLGALAACSGKKADAPGDGGGGLPAPAVGGAAPEPRWADDAMAPQPASPSSVGLDPAPLVALTRYVEEHPELNLDTEARMLPQAAPKETARPFTP